MGAAGWLAPGSGNLSDRRVFILWQLVLALPNTGMVLASNDKGSSARFKDWTGLTQETLEAAWTDEKFVKGPAGSWTRDKKEAWRGVLTSCEGLVLRVFDKIEAAKMGKRKGLATAFNLANVHPKSGMELKTPVGWNWYRDKVATVRPQPGDLFQVGVPTGPKQWTLKHVGLITRWDDNDGWPMWETIEAGQGGPSSGYDSMRRKEYRPVFPIGKADSGATLMGWLDLDEHFG